MFHNSFEVFLTLLKQCTVRLKNTDTEINKKKKKIQVNFSNNPYATLISC